MRRKCRRNDEIFPLKHHNKHYKYCNMRPISLCLFWLGQETRYSRNLGADLDNGAVHGITFTDEVERERSCPFHWVYNPAQEWWKLDSKAHRKGAMGGKLSPKGVKCILAGNVIKDGMKLVNQQKQIQCSKDRSIKRNVMQVRVKLGRGQAPNCYMVR